LRLLVTPPSEVAINKQGQSAKLPKRGKEVKDHLRRVEKNEISTELDEKTLGPLLKNSLEKSIQFELFSYYAHSVYSQDYSWMKIKLPHILGDRSSYAGPLMETFKISQRTD
jgi:hypothetical protein